MFDIGFTELLVCVIVALLVLGPERLPGAVRTVGRWIGRARHTVNQFTDQIDREIRTDELKRRIEQEMKDLGANDVSRQIKDALSAPLPLIGADHLRGAAGEEKPNSIKPPELAAVDEATPAVTETPKIDPVAGDATAAPIAGTPAPAPAPADTDKPA